MNLESITIQDCIEMWQMKGRVTVINDGKVVGFASERRMPTVLMNKERIQR